jgi:hypothetical protein
MRVLKWIVDRVHGRAAVESPSAGCRATKTSTGPASTIRADTFYDLMAVGREAGTAEAHAHEELFDRFFDRLPKEFIFERELLRSRLWRSRPDRWELGGMYVGCARRGLVASAPAPTGYFSAPLSGLEHEGVGLRLARRP